MDDSVDSYAPESPDVSGYHVTPTNRVSRRAATSTYQTRQGRRRSSLEDTQDDGLSDVQADEEEDNDDDYMSDDKPSAGRSNGKRRATKKAKVSSAAGASPSGVTIKTKFPVARIKRIMQADEDVGKVSQVTPVAVSKALELFIVSMVSKAAAEARTTSSKRITAKHLKQAVAKEEVYDFLQDIINKVPEVKAKDEEAVDADEPKRRRGKGKGKASE